MTPVFLDTVGLVAIWDKSDQWHTAAESAYDQIVQSGVEVVTTSYVLLECGNAASRRPYRSRVSVIRQLLMNSQRLIEPSAEDAAMAWAAYDRGEAINAGIVDQVSFVVMRRLGLTRAFTNDAHYRAAGFETMF